MKTKFVKIYNDDMIKLEDFTSCVTEYNTKIYKLEEENEKLKEENNRLRDKVNNIIEGLNDMSIISNYINDLVIELNNETIGTKVMNKS